MNMVKTKPINATNAGGCSSSRENMYCLWENEVFFWKGIIKLAMSI